LRLLQRRGKARALNWFEEEARDEHRDRHTHTVKVLQEDSMVFGQLVIGPPGSGKTTYCNGMSQFLQLIGRYVCVWGHDGLFFCFGNLFPM
jgi:putative protein kinase ArgK-like GTPase of G3E family